MAYELGQQSALAVLGITKTAFGARDAERVLGVAKSRVLKIPRATSFSSAEAGLAAMPRRAVSPGMVRKQMELLGYDAPQVIESAQYNAQRAKPAVERVLDPRKGDMVRAMRQQRLAPANMSAQERYMAEAVGKGHELDELALGRRAHTSAGSVGYHFSTGHTNPDVILREHNRLATLPEGYDAVKAMYTRMRRAGIESRLLAAATGGKVHYGDPTRLSRHARKHIARRQLELVENPPSWLKL